MNLPSQGPEARVQGLTRRDALRAGAGVAGGIALGGGLLGRALESLASPAVVGPGPYGPLRRPDANGVRLPKGFSSKVVARVGQEIGPRPYRFHQLPDGMGTFRTGDRGFILTSNSEMPYVAGKAEIGAAAIRFDHRFRVTDAYPILKGTDINCAGGVTPWGTWLSCEEKAAGRVFECDPYGRKEALARPAMGVFKHEAASVDPVGRKVYMTEDLGDGGFYRFVPDDYPDLSAGRLEIAVVRDSGRVDWARVPDPELTGSVPTRQQVTGSTEFRRGEGMWFDGGVIYFATTQDDRVYAYHCASRELEVLYDGAALGGRAPLNDSDNVTVSPISGDLYVCEDAGDHRMCIISTEGEAAVFVQLPGEEHANSELTGPVFDPTGSRLYFASQRAVPAGVIYEISGPFRKTRRAGKGGSKLRIRTLGRPTLRRLLRAGQPFRLDFRGQSRPVEIEARLVTRLRRAAGKGSRQVTIGRLSARSNRPGSRRIRMRVDRRYVRRLRRLDVARAKLIVTTTDADGRRRRKAKRVRFG